MIKIALILFLAISTTSFSQSIESISRQDFSIFFGQQARLKVEVDKEPLAFRWKMQDVVLSSSQTYLTNKDWEPGFYHIKLELLFSEKILEIPFNIQVYSPKVGYVYDRSKVIEVPEIFKPQNMVVKKRSSLNAVPVGDYVEFLDPSSGYSFVSNEQQSLSQATSMTTSPKGSLVISKKGEWSGVFLSGSKIGFQPDEPGGSINISDGSSYFKFSASSPVIAVAGYDIAGAQLGGVFALLDQRDIGYTLHVLAGSVRIHPTNSEHQEYNIYRGEAISLPAVGSVSQKFYSSLGCFDVLRQQELAPFFDASQCSRPTSDQNRLLSVIAQRFDDPIELKITDDKTVSLKRVADLGDDYPSSIVLKNKDASPVKEVARTFMLANHKKELEALAYDFFFKKNKEKLQSLKEVSQRSAADRLFESELLYALMLGDCGSAESIFDVAPNVKLGSEFHLYYAYFAEECGELKTGWVQLHDLIWWSEYHNAKEESLLTSLKPQPKGTSKTESYTSSSNKDNSSQNLAKSSAQSSRSTKAPADQAKARIEFLSDKFNSSMYQRIQLGYSDNPSQTNQDGVDTTLNPKVVDSGAVLDYELEYSFKLSNLNDPVQMNLVSKASFFLPIAKDQMQYNRFSLSQGLRGDIKGALDFFTFTRNLDLRLFIEPTLGLNIASSKLLSYMMGYNAGIRSEAALGKPSFSYRRTVFEDATDEAENYDFSLNSSIESLSLTNLSAIKNTFALSIGECLSFVCTAEVKYVWVDYHRNPQVDYSRSGLGFGLGFAYKVYPYWTLSAALDIEQLEFLEDLGSYNNNVIDLGLSWEFLPRQFTAISVQSKTTDSDILFLNYSELRYLLAYSLQSI